MKSPSPLSRRQLLAGALATFAAPSASRAQAAPSPGAVRVLRAQVAGYDGIVPGPTLQVARGEEVRVRLINELSEPTALHWHGVRLANAMDGAPPLTQTPIAPGDSFDYRFTAPDAGTYWYHPPGKARRSGYGVLIVREADPVDVDHDHMLIFADARATRAADAAPFTVNGASSFDIRAGQNERLRLRLLNASNDRIIELRVEGLRPFVMATDGEPAQPIAAREGRLSLGPGNRIDLFVDCTLAPGANAPITLAHAGAAADVVRLLLDINLFASQAHHLNVIDDAFLQRVEHRRPQKTVCGELIQRAQLPVNIRRLDHVVGDGPIVGFDFSPSVVDSGKVFLIKPNVAL